MAFNLFGGHNPDHPLATKRSAHEALAALPKDNAQKSLEELHDWIASVGATEGFKPQRRAELFLLLDEAALPFHRKLAHDYASDSRLPKARETRLWRTLFTFWKELAAAYLSCIDQCAAEVTVAGRLKARLPLLCTRAVHAFAGQLKWQYMHYEPEEARTWKAIGRVYRYAEEKKIHREMVRLYPNSPQTSCTEREFVKLLMLAASSPDCLSPLDIELADWIVAHMGASFVFSAAHQPQLTHNYVDLGSGLPPERLIETPSPSPDLRFFAAGPASGELDEVIRVLQSGAPPSGLNLGGTYEPATVLSACLRLKASWSALPPATESDRYEVSHRPGVSVLEDDVFALTPKGRAELDGAGTSLSASEIEVLVLIDGRSNVGETAARTRTLGKERALDVLRKFAQDGLIEIAKISSGALDFVDFFESKGALTPSASASATAQAKRASAATALLLLQRGYFVRIARRSSAKRGPGKAHRLSILAVEDEPVLASMLKHVLEAEGFSVRNAKNRAQIVAELRQPPLPDLVLLDVMLPDVDGFEVLHKIRQHPALTTLPVVMLTAKATRDGVLKGITGGADGYITKPFEIRALVKAVNAVLGLSEEGLLDNTDEDPWGL